MRRNVDGWPHIEAGAEAIIVTASGCQLRLALGAELRGRYCAELIAETL